MGNKHCNCVDCAQRESVHALRQQLTLVQALLAEAQRCVSHVLDANGDLNAIDFDWLRRVAGDNGTQVGEASEQGGASTHTQVPNLAELTRAIQNDVLAGMAAGFIPLGVTNFGDLHSYCDANCLGGLCDDGKCNALIEHYGGRDANEGMPDGMMDLINSAQDAVDRWLCNRWPGGINVVGVQSFANAPGDVGRAWAAVTAAEFNLASRLQQLPKGCGYAVGNSAWFLVACEGGAALCLGHVQDGKVVDAIIQSELGLDWVELDKDEVLQAANQMEHACDSGQLLLVDLGED